MVTDELETRSINVIRALAMDAVQKANSGHPGTPMALAPLADVLWTRVMQYDASDPDWPDRDRFVLSAGHASMLLYSMLYLTGFGLELDDLRNFRQLGSRTPGHPEYRHTKGVEVTTGPLGQGLGDAVGAAIAEEDRPSLVVLRSHIGYPSAKVQDTAAAHGNALGADEVARVKEILGLPPEDFFVPDDVLARYRAAGQRGREAHTAWTQRRASWLTANPGRADEYEACLAGRPLGGLE